MFYEKPTCKFLALKECSNQHIISHSNHLEHPADGLITPHKAFPVDIEVRSLIFFAFSPFQTRHKHLALHFAKFKA